MTDSYVYVITALLPLTAFILVLQSNPYHALVIRGILGAMAVLVYTVLGAADVALTEALVGNLLAITLYAVAVRSSLVLRLGVLKEAIAPESAIGDPQESHFRQLINDLQTIFGKRHMRVELVPYLDRETLHQALMDKEVHAICARSEQEDDRDLAIPATQHHPYTTTTRLRRLYDIMQTELASSATRLNYAHASDSKEIHL
jgi:putative multicomponent Na+:H+ antiporter subunit B